MTGTMVEEEGVYSPDSSTTRREMRWTRGVRSMKIDRIPANALWTAPMRPPSSSTGKSTWTDKQSLRHQRANKQGEAQTVVALG